MSRLENFYEKLRIYHSGLVLALKKRRNLTKNLHVTCISVNFRLRRSRGGLQIATRLFGGEVRRVCVLSCRTRGTHWDRWTHRCVGCVVYRRAPTLVPFPSGHPFLRWSRPIPAETAKPRSSMLEKLKARLPARQSRGYRATVRMKSLRNIAHRFTMSQDPRGVGEEAWSQAQKLVSRGMIHSLGVRWFRPPWNFVATCRNFFPLTYNSSGIEVSTWLAIVSTLKLYERWNEKPAAVNLKIQNCTHSSSYDICRIKHTFSIFQFSIPSF